MNPLNLFFAFSAAALFCLGAASQAHADERDFSGTVTKIFDGDSFLVRPPRGREIDVRLIDIDAPEKLQPHADHARAALQELIGARAVFVDVIDVDQYGRKLARVYREPDRLDVTRTLVHDGHVWVYRRTVRDRSLIPLEEAAKAARTGLWSLPASDRIPPWRYRYFERQKKNGGAAKDRKKEDE
jgi:endonuclease YncB( thermonuclease family)